MKAEIAVMLPQTKESWQGTAGNDLKLGERENWRGAPDNQSLMSIANWLDVIVLIVNVFDISHKEWTLNREEQFSGD